MTDFRLYFFSFAASSTFILLLQKTSCIAGDLSILPPRSAHTVGVTELEKIYIFKELFLRDISGWHEFKT